MATSAVALGTPVNDANWVSFGGAGAFAPHKTIRMLGEDINITIYDDKIHVRVWFSFRNDGPETTVTMAFPFDTVEWYEDMVLSFASKVDGKPVAIKRVEVPNDDPELDGWVKQFAYTKEVSFNEGQTRYVLVDYKTKHGYAGSGYQFNSYILKTGATWAGTIGNITISVDWSHVKRISRPDLQFWRGRSIEQDAQWVFMGKNRATVSFADIEPDFNLDLSSIQGFWNVRLNGKRLDSSYGIAGATGPILKGDPWDPAILVEGIDDLLLDWFEDRKIPRGKYRSHYTVEADAIRLNNGRKVRLTEVSNMFRKATGSKLSSWSYVRLKDLIEELGGSMKWNASLDQLDLSLPKN